MKTKQVLSVEQMKHLQELGLDTSDVSMCVEWRESDENKKVVASLDADTYYDYYYETYTLQDILDKLPPIIDEVYWLTLEVMDRQKNEWKIKYARINAEHECASFSSQKLIDAAYRMLCWCIENGYVGKEGG